MLLSQFLSLCRRYSRSAFDTSMYSNSDVGYAAQSATDEWIRNTHATRTAATLTLTAGSNIAPAMPSDWLPEQHLQSELLLSTSSIFPQLQFTTYEQVLTAYASNGQLTNTGNTFVTGQPTLLGYSTRTDGLTFPIPDKAYTVQEWYWTQFTSFTPGTALLSASTNGLNGISAISVSNGGTYVSAPTLTISGGSGSGAAATVVMSTSNTDQVASITVTASGSGYTSVSLTLSGENALDRVTNLPDDHLRAVALNGAPWVLHSGEAENQAITKTKRDQFEVDMSKFRARGAGGRGPRVAFMAPPFGQYSGPVAIPIPSPNVP